MSKECILKNSTGFDSCSAEWLGEFAMQICCSGCAKHLTTLQLMVEIANHTNIGDVAQLVNFDAYEGEDPRIVRLLNDLRERGIPLRTVDDNYLSDDEFRQLRRFDLRDLE